MNGMVGISAKVCSQKLVNVSDVSKGNCIFFIKRGKDYKWGHANKRSMLIHCGFCLELHGIS
jgi:hypothetical protein